jgi:signal transduction histidine kinase
VFNVGLFTKTPSTITFASQRRFKRLLPFWPLLIAGMVVLLLTVAILQYRWTNEIGAATEERVGTQLQSLMTKWQSDLYGEFSAICIAMQVGPDSGARDTWDDYLQRYLEWRSAPSHDTVIDTYKNPDLIQDIYIWDTNLSTEPRLLRLDTAHKSIENSSIPANLQPLLSRLLASSGSLSAAQFAWRLPSQPEQQLPSRSGSGDSVRSNPNAGWQFDDSIPAIVHPLLQRDNATAIPPRGRNPVDWIVVVLNMKALQKRILPELATRYFGGLEGLDYKVAVVATGKTERPIYASDPGFGTQESGSVDASMNIFATSAWFPVFKYESVPDPWMLLVQRRAGTLQAVISQVRQKNLAISAFVLILLAASIGILAVAGLRAQKFANMQMDFVASFSHELRTPLTAIFSAGENIKDGVISGKAGLHHYGSIVMGQTRRLMDHVDRIMLFAAIRSGKDRYNLRPLQVADVLQRVCKNMSALFTQETYTIEQQVQPNLPCVMGDLFAVCGCVENLLTNAVKYNRKDNPIRVSAKLSDLGNEVAISVEDHGIGISSADLKQIFEPFYRSPEVQAAQIHGTGLGLPLARHLAEAMGGRLTVTSELGVGSVFTLHLLTAEPTQGELAPTSDASDVARGENEREHSCH